MKIALFLSFWAFSTAALAQTAPFSIYLEPHSIQGVGGLQSFAFGQHEGKWLIVGGRLDGLHRRQPWASFDIAGHNTRLWVIDPQTQQHWTAPLTSLSVALQEQLAATNMEFRQSGDYLYLVGGYGYSATAGDHKTFDNLTAIRVPSVIQAIINGTNFQTNDFRQISAPEFAVTGGRLEKIYDTYYLVGGQKFDGRYNPMNGPSFTQVYTNQIRRFTLQDDGNNLSVNQLAPWTDNQQLHRRDYNVLPQILPNGQEGLTAFSGVFQTAADIPYLNCVNVDSAGYAPHPTFAQYYNHYHCANIPIYSAADNEMHNLFFGGIAQYYDSLGILVQDNQVPFVRTIARVTRTASGAMAEYKLPIEMPALLGAGAEFIVLDTLPQYANGVLRLDDLQGDTVLLGYIYGGINSSAANIFWMNEGELSSASPDLFKVFLIKNTASATHQLNAQSLSGLQLQVYPNPNNGIFTFTFYLKKAEPLRLSIYDMEGALLLEERLADITPGKNSYTKRLEGLDHGGVYLLVLKTAKETATQKIIVGQ